MLELTEEWVKKVLLATACRAALSWTQSNGMIEMRAKRANAVATERMDQRQA